MGRMGFIMRGASIQTRVGEMLSSVKPNVMIVEADEFGKRLASLLAAKQHMEDTATLVYAPTAIEHGGTRYSLDSFSAFMEDAGGNEKAAEIYGEVIRSYKDQLPPGTYIRLFPVLDLQADGETADMETSFAEFIKALLPLIGDANIMLGAFDIEQVLRWDWVNDVLKSEGFSGRVMFDFHMQITHAMLLDFAVAATPVNIVYETLFKRQKLNEIRMVLETSFVGAGGKGLRAFVNGIEGDETSAVKWLFDMFNTAFMSRPYVHSVVFGYIGALDASTLVEDFSRHATLLTAISEAHELIARKDEESDTGMGGSIITTYLSPKRYVVDEECFVYEHPTMSAAYATEKLLHKGDVIDVVAIRVNRGVQWAVIDEHGQQRYVPLINMMTGTQYAHPSQREAPNVFYTPSNFTTFVAKRDVYLYEHYADAEPSKKYYIGKGAVVSLSDEVVAGRRVFRTYYHEDEGGKKLYVPIAEWDKKGKRTTYFERVGTDTDVSSTLLDTVIVLTRRLDEVQARLDGLLEYLKAQNPDLQL